MATDYDPGKLLKSLGGGPAEKGESILSAFSTAPAPEKQYVLPPGTTPEPPPAPPAPPPILRAPSVQPETTAAVGNPDLPARRKPLEEPAGSRPPPPPQNRELIDYMTQKISELEKKLIESQEKGLAFAYEVKGREEARKESRREMEEFLAEVKKQQADTEARYSRGLELEKARTRIEALELKIVEFAAPRPEPPKPEIPEETLVKLKSGLMEEVAALLKDELEKYQAALKREPIPELKPEIARLRSGLDQELEEHLRTGFLKLKSELRVELTFDIKEGLAAQFREMSLAVEKSRTALEESLKKALQAGGAEAADAKVRSLAESSSAYNLGFVTSCLDNLEKTFSEASETLARAGFAARQAATSPGSEALLAIRRTAAILDSAFKDMSAALKVFKEVREEAMAPINKTLGNNKGT